VTIFTAQTSIRNYPAPYALSVLIFKELRQLAYKPKNEGWAKVNLLACLATNSFLLECHLDRQKIAMTFVSKLRHARNNIKLTFAFSKNNLSLSSGL